MSQYVPPPVVPGLSWILPPVTPLTETSARWPPFWPANSDGVRQAVDAGRGGRVLLPIARSALVVAHGIDALVDQRSHLAVAFVDHRLDDAVVERPLAAAIGDGHGGTCTNSRYDGRSIGGAEQRYEC